MLLWSHFRSQSPFQRDWISMASLKRDPHKQGWELCPWEIFREVDVKPWRLKEILRGGETAIDGAAWSLAYSQAQRHGSVCRVWGHWEDNGGWGVAYVCHLCMFLHGVVLRRPYGTGSVWGPGFQEFKKLDWMSYYPVPELVILLPFLMDFIIDIPVSLSIAIFFPPYELFVCFIIILCSVSERL